MSTKVQTTVQKKTTTTRKASNVVKSSVAMPITTVPSVSVYVGLDKPFIDKLELLAGEIEREGQEATKHLLTVGKALQDARAVLHHKQKGEGFQSWVKERLDMSHTYATELINAYEYHNGLDDVRKLKFMILTLSVQRQIAAPSTPPEASEAILEVAGETGKSPKAEQTENTIQAAKVIRKETSQPAKVVDLKKVVETKKQHGNSTAAKSTKPTVSTSSTTKEPPQPKTPQPTDKSYSPSENGVVLERIHAELLALKQYVGPADKPDVYLLKSDIEALWQFVCREISSK